MAIRETGGTHFEVEIVLPTDASKSAAASVINGRVSAEFTVGGRFNLLTNASSGWQP